MSQRMRPYSEPSDMVRILDLLLVCQAAGYADAEFRSIELRMMLGNPAFAADRLTLLVEDDSGDLAALAVLWQGRYLGTLVRPDQRGRLEDWIIQWAVERVQGEESSLWALCRDDDRLSRDLLERDGFKLDELELRMVRDLHEQIPPPRLPDGFILRGLDPARELDDWLSLYRETIGDRPAILQRWRRIRDDVDYDASLDLVAVDQDGRLAAMCHCSIPSFEVGRTEIKEGRTEPIAVAATYRRKGLGRAIVLSGLHLLKSRGMDRALLTTESDNVPAHRLYESLGYRLSYHACWYTKPL